MNKQYKQALIILTLLVSVPVIVFAVYEYSSITREEKLVAEVYETQLNSILFSVNLYSEDIISSWQIKLMNRNEPADDPKTLNEFLKENPSIKLLYTFDPESDQTTIQYDGSGKSIDETKAIIDSILKNNTLKISKLFDYLKSGYRKAEPVNDTLNSDLTHILFASVDGMKKLITGISIDPKQFINKTLEPRLQVIAQEKLVISIFNKRTGEKVYSNFPGEKGEARNDKILWLLPGYEMAIKPLNTTIEDIAKKRKQENLIITGALALLLSAGAIFLLKNIRKEIRLSEIKSEFVSNVSHELRTPLSLINMFAETLSLGRVKSDEKKQEYYEIIGRETERLSAIVNKILNFSQMESGKRKYKFEEVDMNELVEKIYDSYKFHLKNKGFEVTFEKEENLPLIQADHGAISEAVINLLDNGIKYSKDKKELSIRTGKDGKYLFVSVADKGIGISTEDKKKIFEKFFRVSSDNVHNTKGTGLGLSIVKEIAAAHDGIVEVESNPGKGSTFTLKFMMKENKQNV
ncbi:MAG: ATP-binding protein [Ignavibacteria bacterium]|nr:ATP-binding protein [Ignavibacteria bacterium]